MFIGIQILQWSSFVLEFEVPAVYSSTNYNGLDEFTYLVHVGPTNFIIKIYCYLYMEQIQIFCIIQTQHHFILYVYINVHVYTVIPAPIKC